VEYTPGELKVVDSQRISLVLVVAVLKAKAGTGTLKLVIDGSSTQNINWASQVNGEDMPAYPFFLKPGGYFKADIEGELSSLQIRSQTIS
jgi:hypothetical protein